MSRLCCILHLKTFLVWNLTLYDWDSQQIVFAANSDYLEVFETSTIVVSWDNGRAISFQAIVFVVESFIWITYNPVSVMGF